MPKDRFAGAARAIDARDPAAYAWQAPLLLRDLTLEEAEDAAGITSRISEDINDSETCSTGASSGSSATRSNGPVWWGSAMDDVVRDVHGRLVAIDGATPAAPCAGILVALVVVAGAGAFAMAARRVESNLLFARGARPRAVAGRAALEGS